MFKFKIQLILFFWAMCQVSFSGDRIDFAEGSISFPEMQMNNDIFTPKLRIHTEIKLQDEKILDKMIETLLPYFSKENTKELFSHYQLEEKINTIIATGNTPVINFLTKDKKYFELTINVNNSRVAENDTIELSINNDHDCYAINILRINNSDQTFQLIDILLFCIT